MIWIYGSYGYMAPTDIHTMDIIIYYIYIYIISTYYYIYLHITTYR